MEQGGYRRFDDSVALRTFIGAIEAGGPLDPQALEAARARDISAAFIAALSDTHGELKACIRQADPIIPHLQYSLGVKLIGRPGVGTYIASVEFLRLVPNQPTPTLLPTTASACVEAILATIALPPSEGDSQVMTVLRYDGCTPKRR